MAVDVPTLTMVSALTSASVALALAFSLRTDIAAIGTSLRIWAAGIAIQAIGWLLAGMRGTISDATGIVLANTLVVLGFAECERALRAFGGRRAQPLTYVPVFLVTLASIVLTYAKPDRDLRMVVISALFAFVLALASAEALRVNAEGWKRPRSQRLTAATLALAGGTLLCRAIWIPAAGQSVMVTIIVIYACAAVAPVVASLGFALMCTDRLDRELAYLASMDPLTGAHNRRSLESIANREIKAAERHGHSLAVLVIDIDHFKRVNDEQGHEAGDAALRSLTQIVHACLREEDTISRLGGDEFVVLMPHADTASAMIGAERLRTAVEAGARMSISIGVAEWSTGEGLFDMLRRADDALYRAKEGGRNRIEASSSPRGTSKTLKSAAASTE